MCLSQQCPRNLQRKKPSELDIEIPPKGKWRVWTKLSNDLSSGSKQRVTNSLQSSLKEMSDVIQGLDKEILDLSTEEEIVSEIEKTDQFCSKDCIQAKWPIRPELIPVSVA